MGKVVSKAIYEALKTKERFGKRQRSVVLCYLYLQDKGLNKEL